jgi:iron complex outermembrane recepter protein
MRNPDTSATAPYYIVGKNIGIATYTPGGLITGSTLNTGKASTLLKGTYFGVNGTVNQLSYGAVSGQWMQGGDWQYSTSGILGSNSLQSEDKRKSVFTRASYELFQNVEAFVQASYARYEGLSYYISPTTTGITISRDNAFLPASVAQQMAANNIASFSMGTSNEDMPASGSANERGTQRYVAGATHVQRSTARARN